ncbi:MAG: hypothetical protein AMS20_04950 [Gemmatimonas sp. SG8_28]|nr:MAG: hypothetical protein AMS20_04950 [Gemmatimonas sp. SG8_28]
MRIRLRPLSLTLTGLLIGCAYYNGLYNANRLAGEADRAEREGRVGEARSLWAQAAVKAESVATRYPDSRHRDDALLLWGRGLAHAGDCRRAVGPLGFAVDSSPDAGLRRVARLLLADCRLLLRQPSQAIIAVEPLLADSDSAVVQEALRFRGSAHLAAGDAERAVAQVPLETGGLELARAYTAHGALDRAVGTLQARASGAYRESEWRTALDELGARSPDRAAAVVDRLVARTDLTPGQRARVLAADAERRWERGDLAAAVQRYREVESVAADSAEGGVARSYLAVAALRMLADLQELPAVEAQLADASRGGGTASRVVQPARDVAQAARMVLEDPTLPARDLKLFVVGEMLRDSLDAPNPATALFLAIAAQHPNSRFAPKALLAAAMLDPSRADSVREVLQVRYPYSPYTMVLHGEAGTQFAALEDSLRVLLQLERQRLAVGRSPAAAEAELRRDRRPNR